MTKSITPRSSDPVTIEPNLSRELVNHETLWLRNFISKQTQRAYSRNPNFPGREPELAALRQALTTEHSAALTALSGLGGVGKTQLALEYSYRHEAGYAGIWWFRAEAPEGLGNDMGGVSPNHRFFRPSKLSRLRCFG
jgi:hypothetical protein